MILSLSENMLVAVPWEKGFSSWKVPLFVSLVVVKSNNSANYCVVAYSTTWTSRVWPRAQREAGARRGTRTAAAAVVETRSQEAVAPTRPCDSTAWAGAARATRAGPGSASSCFKDLNVLKQLVAWSRKNQHHADTHKAVLQCLQYAHLNYLAVKVILYRIDWIREV